MFTGKGELWNVLGRFDGWNLCALVITLLGCASVSVDYHPEGMPIFVDLSSC